MINPGIFGGTYSDAGMSSTLASRQAASAQSDANTARRDVHFLADRLDRLSLVCMAMWSLIQDKTDLKEEDLLERVRTLDLMDGVADGKASRSVSKCVKCQRVMSPRHNRCLYCGAERLVSSAFDAV